jgi:hypothetical protein
VQGGGGKHWAQTHVPAAPPPARTASARPACTWRAPPSWSLQLHRGRQERRPGVQRGERACQTERVAGRRGHQRGALQLDAAARRVPPPAPECDNSPVEQGRTLPALCFFAGPPAFAPAAPGSSSASSPESRSAVSQSSSSPMSWYLCERGAGQAGTPFPSLFKPPAPRQPKAPPTPLLSHTPLSRATHPPPASPTMKPPVSTRRLATRLA